VKVGMVTAYVSHRGGGLSEVVKNLAVNLPGRGCSRLQVYALEDPSEHQDESLWRGASLRTFVPRESTAFLYSPEMAQALFRDTDEILHEHGMWLYPSCACRAWSRKTGRPYVVSPHGSLEPWALRNSPWKKHIAAWLYENRNLAGAACLHALNESEVRSIRAYGLTNPIAVIPNGVSLPASAGDHPKDATVFGVEDGKKVLLFLGRLHPKKGLLNLIRAWQHVADSAREPWHLAVAGWNEGNYEQEVRALVKHLGIENSVTFIGPQYGPAKAAAFQNASAFVLPSFSEGQPVAVLEAWASKLPVLMTPECNLTIGYESTAAIRITPDPAGISAGLGELFAMSSAMRRDMGERGRLLAKDHFNWPIVCDQFVQLYKWLLGGGSRPAFVLAD